MKHHVALVLVAALLVGGVAYGLMFTPLGDWLAPDGPRGFLLRWDCETCRNDFLRGKLSDPHGHVVYFIEPQDKLRRDGLFWRYCWEGRPSFCARDRYVFLPSNDPPHPAYVAAKSGLAHQYSDELSGEP